MASDLAAFLEAFQGGDPEAFVRFYEAFKRPLYFHCRKITKDEHFIQTAVDDAFMAARDREEKFTTVEGLKKYLYVVTQRIALSLIKSLRYNISTDPEEMEKISPAEELDIKETEALYSLFIELVFEVIDNLPDRQQQIIRLQYLQNLSTEEIANQLQINQKSVQNQSLTARENILKIFKARGYDEYIILLLLSFIFFQKVLLLTMGFF